MSDKEETSLGNTINYSSKWRHNALGQKGEGSGWMEEERVGKTSYSLGEGGVKDDFGGRASI